MTYKLLIVDDEPIICRGLQMTVPWSDYQVEVAAIAFDGQDAIQKLKEHGDIDFVLTDVTMPNMDGIELASFIAKNYPKIRTVIISGYDEFKYAQQAIQLGVRDYLLKPVEVNELLDVIQKITAEIQEQRKELQQYWQLNIKNAIFHQVFEAAGPVAKELELVAGVRIYPLLTMIREYRQAVAQSSEDIQAFNTNWENSISDKLRQNGLESVSLFTDKNCLLSCLVDYPGQLQPEEIFSIFEDSSLLFVFHDTDILLKDLSAVYPTLVKDSKYLPFYEQGFVTSPVKQTFTKAWRDEIGAELISTIFKCQWSKVRTGIQRLFSYLENERFFLDEAAQVCSQILEKAVGHYAALFRREPDQTELYFKKFVDVSLSNSYRLLREMFEHDIEHILSQLDVKNADSKDWLIERAETYIKQYFQKPIKAQEVADVIHISPNYFSTLFKHKTGKSFNEYVNHLRVEAAKELLEETLLNVNEIAEKVGYREYKYFVDVFKKQTGYTPTNYRKLASSK